MLFGGGAYNPANLFFGEVMLSLCVYPHPALLAPTQKITQFDAALQQLGAEMLTLMYKTKGVGLAAPQIGRSIRLIVIDLDPENPQPLLLVNPEIVEKSREKEIDEEGCLSFPEIRARIPRAKQVNVAAQSVTGEKIEFTADGLLARCLQHEVDHLENIFFVDRASVAAKLSLKPALVKLRERAEAIKN
ncbi:peptide deformylase 2 [Planctomycetales bacterium]|nr:peptide deformylase 2 [Planctomycetales bacterium]